jgi:hypothetical protein
VSENFRPGSSTEYTRAGQRDKRARPRGAVTHRVAPVITREPAQEIASAHVGPPPWASGGRNPWKYLA